MFNFNIYNYEIFLYAQILVVLEFKYTVHTRGSVFFA